MRGERRAWSGIGRGGLSLLTCGLLAACGGSPAPAPGPAPAPSRRPAPTPTPAQEPKPKPSPVPSQAPESDNLVWLEVAGPRGSRLSAGKIVLQIPGRLRLAPDAELSLAGRITLNSLSQALKIPAQARPLVRGNSAGLWVEVTAACSLKGSTSKAPIKLRLGEAELVHLLEAGVLELSDPAGRASLKLALKRDAPAEGSD